MTSIAGRLRSGLLARSFTAIYLPLPNLGKIPWPMTSSTRHLCEIATPSHFQRLSSLCKVRLPIPSLPSSLGTVVDIKATPSPPLVTRAYANSASPSSWPRLSGGNNLFMAARSNGVKHTSGSFSSFMPRRSMSSIWKGAFVDPFLLKMKMKKERLNNTKIWSRRSTILPEFVGGNVLIYNGKSFVRCKINEEKVGYKFGVFAVTRKRRPLPLKAEKGAKEKGKKGKK